MAKVTRSTSSSENSSALKRKAGPTASKGTAHEKYMRGVICHPQFKRLEPSGKTFAIIGALPIGQVIVIDCSRSTRNWQLNSRIAGTSLRPHRKENAG